jgi:DNA-binding transcriptional ArsR family regulator
VLIHDDLMIDREVTLLPKAVVTISNPRTANVLVDPMRREIVRLLAEGQRTESDLAESMGLSDPSVGHHLKVLRECGLIRIVRREAEEHGIVQKFYESNATVYLVDSHNMPQDIDRYFMPISLERVRGIMAGANLILKENNRLNEKDVEDFAKVFASAIIRASSRFSRQWKGTREELLATLYRNALKHVLNNPTALPDSIRELLMRAFAT